MAWRKGTPTATPRSGEKSALRVTLPIRSRAFSPMGTEGGAPRRTSAPCFLIFVVQEFTAVNVTLVCLNVSVPFLRHIFLREDGRHRTDRNTGTAVNALTGIDIQLRHFIERRASIVIGAAFRRMDTIHRAYIHTRGILGSNTRFGNDIGHQSPPMYSLTSSSAIILFISSMSAVAGSYPRSVVIAVR